MCGDMRKTKVARKAASPSFLKSAFSAEQAALALQVKLSSTSISHPGVKGEVNERHFIQALRRYLPERYAIEHGIVIDSEGATSDQIDIVIFDRHYTPTLLDQQSHRYIPAEAVYCVLEVKPKIDKGYLKYAADKAASVRKLKRTSVPIKHSDGERPPKVLFPILAGIVAADADWSEGIQCRPFLSHLKGLTGNRALDCGLALSDRCFDSYDGRLFLSPKTNSLAYFIFRLLQKLQLLGTVPAVDWGRYAQLIGAEGHGIPERRTAKENGRPAT